MPVLSQEKLAERFNNGDTVGQASNMSIREVEDGTEIIGYGHAVYAHRDRQTGRITLYEGWRTYSHTTACQLGKLREYADELSDNNPSA